MAAEAEAQEPPPSPLAAPTVADMADERSANIAELQNPLFPAG
jgi:hypothetical protein